MPDQPSASSEHSPSPPLRVLVADDNPVVRAGLTALLGDHPDIEVVAQAVDGEEALRLAGAHHPDVVLLDVRMPGTDGLTALPGLAALAPVMMLTYSAEPEVAAEALRRGASGYLVHGEFTAPELIEAVRAVRAGRRPVSPSLKPLDPLGVSHKTHELAHQSPEGSSQVQSVVAQSSQSSLRSSPRRYNTPNQMSYGLSSREVEVMDLIASGMNNRQIATTCFISEKTVKNHINRIFAKLHSSSRSEAIAHWLGTAREGWSR